MEPDRSGGTGRGDASIVRSDASTLGILVVFRGQSKRVGEEHGAQGHRRKRRFQGGATDHKSRTKERMAILRTFHHDSAFRTMAVR